MSTPGLKCIDAQVIAIQAFFVADVATLFPSMTQSQRRFLTVQ